MRKHIRSVVSSIRSNPWQFIGVFLITLILIYFIYITFYRICYLPPVQFGIVIPNPSMLFLPSAFVLHVGANILNILWIILGLGVVLAVGAFISAGFLHCLELTDKKDDWLKTFFVQGAKRFPKTLPTSIINFLILFGIVALFALIPYLFRLDVSAPIVGILLLASVIVLSNFFVFMVFESVFSKKCVTKLIPDACNKALKVFGNLTIISLIIWILFTSIMMIFGISKIYNWSTFYSLLAVGSLIHLLSIVFLYYPLYKNATELLGEKIGEPEKVESQKTEEPEERVHKTEYIGSDNYVFHKTTCFHVKQIAPGTEDYFETREEAIEKGYEPCKHCRP